MVYLIIAVILIAMLAPCIVLMFMLGWMVQPSFEMRRFERAARVLKETGVYKLDD